MTHALLCVCPSPHSHTTAQTRMQNLGVGVPSSCALLGIFAITAQVSLLWQHSPNAKCQWVLVLAVCLVAYVKSYVHWVSCSAVLAKTMDTCRSVYVVSVVEYGSWQTKLLLCYIHL